MKRALAELPELVGRFEKPKFFDYDPALCAHGRSGIQACPRCLDTCPAGAIRSHGERVEIDPNLCQGAGSCATACPTGAITYAYPRSGIPWSDCGPPWEPIGRPGATGLRSAAVGQETLTRLALRLPDSVLPIRIEEISSVGMDVWLAAIAYSAARVILLGPPGTPSLECAGKAVPRTGFK